MNSKSEICIDDLPLSWSMTNQPKTKSLTRKVKFNNTVWLAYQQFTEEENLSDNFIERGKTNYIIRGCNSDQKKSLGNFGFTSFQFGMEAILKTESEPFKKKSLKELVRRGLRNGKVIELPFSQSNSNKLKNFIKETVHGNSPQLTNLFQTKFTIQNRLYVFVDENSNWLAAILTSNNSQKKIHTELLLRKSSAPIGVMEALVQNVFEDAIINNQTELSLGEVPFLYNSNRNFLVKFLKALNPIVNFTYNYKGLQDFKNKFQPTWQPLYICSTNKLKIYDVFIIFFHSSFTKLFLHKLLYRLKN